MTVFLVDLYDGDKRLTDPDVQALGDHPIPHPLNNVQYADGISPCRHGKTHKRFEHCNHPVQASRPQAPRNRDLVRTTEAIRDQYIYGGWERGEHGCDEAAIGAEFDAWLGSIRAGGTP